MAEQHPRTRPLLRKVDHGSDDDFRAFHSAAATLAGIEIAHMTRRGQFDA